ncbi:MAG: chitobiase/beta-hexosaminidase C-terminal domain-containing protein [Roseburia sp.]
MKEQNKRKKKPTRVAWWKVMLVSGICLFGILSPLTGSAANSGIKSINRDITVLTPGAGNTWNKTDGHILFIGQNGGYRVLNPSPATQTLTTSKSLLLELDVSGHGRRFDDANHNWIDSEMRDWLNNTWFSRFADLERGVIAETTLLAAGSYTYNSVVYSDAAESTDKIFLLSIKEQAELYENAEARKRSLPNLYTRTAVTDNILKVGRLNDGALGVHNDARTTLAIAPALNLDAAASSILFASENGMDKTSPLAEVQGSSETQWKLTLVDSAKSVGLRSGLTLARDGDTIIVPYSYTGSGVTQISVMITDQAYGSGFNVLYYGALEDIRGVDGNAVIGSVPQEGSGTFELPSALNGRNWGQDYFVYIIAEQVNQTNRTDYASTPVEINLPGTPRQKIDEVRITFTIPEPTASFPEKSGFTIVDGANNNISNWGDYTVTWKKKVDGSTLTTSDTADYATDYVVSVELTPNDSYFLANDTQIIINGNNLNSSTALIPGAVGDYYGVTADYEITTRNRRITSIVAPNEIELANGVTKEVVRQSLPAKVKINVEDSIQREVNVTWQDFVYDPSKKEAHEIDITGTIGSLPTGVDQNSPEIKETTIKVKIQDAQKINSVALTDIAAPTVNQPFDTMASTASAEVSPASLGVRWTEKSGASASGNVKYDTAYVASLDLVPALQYGFDNNTKVTVNGQPATSVQYNAGNGTLTVTYEFAPTAKATVNGKGNLTMSARISGEDPQAVIAALPGTIELYHPTQENTGDTSSQAKIVWNTDPLTNGSGYNRNNLNAQQVTIMGTINHSSLPSYVEATGQNRQVSLTIAFHEAPAVERPSATIPENTYTANQYVELSSATTDARIYYTLDGSEPDSNSTQYLPGNPIEIAGVAGTEKTVVLKAIAYKDYRKPSTVAQYTYLIKITREINKVEITGLDAPASGAPLDTDAVSATAGVANGSSLAVMWAKSSAPSISVSGAAEYNEEYTASIALQAEPQNQLSSATAVTVNGNPATAVYNPTNNTLTVSYVFPRTAVSKLLSITEPQPLSVKNATLFADMMLPDKVAIVTEGNVEVEAAVDWRLGAPEHIGTAPYDPSDVNEQTVVIKGYVDLPSTIDSAGITPETKIQITIRQSDHVGAPQETPHEGDYLTDQQVSLKSTTNDAKIRYTISTDGNPPVDPTRDSGEEYGNPIPVTGRPGETVTTIIKAIAYKDGQQDSIVQTFTYRITLPKPKYIVTVQEGSGSGSHEEGNNVVAVANPPISGMQFKEWQGADGLTLLRGTTKNSAVIEFTMPAYNVTLTAVYEPIQPTHVHEFGSEWTHDATHHWHSCINPGCDGAVQDKGEHVTSEWILDRDATDTTDGMRHKECTICGRILVTQTLVATGETYQEVYRIIKGSDQSVQKGVDRTATIHIDGELDDFLWVRVQGENVDAKYYTLRRGSTILTFLAEYLDSLAPGVYEVTFGFANGFGRTTLTIVDPNARPAQPSQSWTNSSTLSIDGHADLPKSPKTGE